MSQKTKIFFPSKWRHKKLDGPILIPPLPTIDILSKKLQNALPEDNESKSAAFDGRKKVELKQYFQNNVLENNQLRKQSYLGWSVEYYVEEKSFTTNIGTIRDADLPIPHLRVTWVSNFEDFNREVKVTYPCTLLQLADLLTETTKKILLDFQREYQKELQEIVNVDLKDIDNLPQEVCESKAKYKIVWDSEFIDLDSYKITVKDIFDFYTKKNSPLKYWKIKDCQDWQENDLLELLNKLPIEKKNVILNK